MILRPRLRPAFPGLAFRARGEVLFRWQRGRGSLVLDQYSSVRSIVVTDRSHSVIT